MSLCCYHGHNDNDDDDVIANSTFQGDSGPIGEPGPRGPDGRIVSHINYLYKY